MKKLRLFLGAIAFVFAFATAFAFKAEPAAVNPAQLVGGVCETVQVACDGNAIPCKRDIGGTSTAIFDKQTSACPELQMDDN